MKQLPAWFALCLLASATIAGTVIGCSRVKVEARNESGAALEPMAEDELFARNHGAVWVKAKLDPVQSKQFTADFQDGLFSEGSNLACDLLVTDVQRQIGVLILCGVSLSNFGNFEIEVSTNMVSSIRMAGGKFSWVRIAFQVESFKRTENGSSDNSSDRFLIRGKATAVEPIPETGTRPQ
jgi:hypothetical protein